MCQNELPSPSVTIRRDSCSTLEGLYRKNCWCSYCLPPVSEKEQQDHTKLHSTKSQANFRVTLKVLFLCVCIPKQFIASGALLTPVSQSGV